MNKFIRNLGLFFFLYGIAFSGVPDTERLIKESVQLYFQKKFNSAARDMRINFIRLPRQLPGNDGRLKAEVYSQRSARKLGYQTVWVKLLSASRLVKKFPVSVDVALRKKVWLTERKIKFHGIISADMLRPEKRFIRFGLDKVISEARQICGMEAKQVIAAGTVITSAHIRKPPMVKRNQKVTVRIEGDHFSIRTHGIARGEGSKGELISVRCPSTGKLFKARILGSGEVLVAGEYTL